MSWKEMFLDLGTETPVGVISTDPPATFELEGVRADSSPLSSADAAFVVKQDRKKLQNVALLDLELKTQTRGYNFRLLNQEKIIGLVIAIPHRVQVYHTAPTKFTPLAKQIFDFTPASPPGDQMVPSGKPSPTEDMLKEQPKVLPPAQVGQKAIIYQASLTTHLCIGEEQRSQKLAMVLIRAAIQKGYTEKIYIGYQFTADARSKSAVPVKGWYRPLDPQKAGLLGYTLVVFPHKDQTQMANHLYLPKLSYLSRPTTRDDFRSLVRRTFMLAPPNEEEWLRLNAAPLVWRTVLDSKGRALVVGCYRKFMLRNPKGLVKSANLVYLEAVKKVKDDDVISAIESFFATIAKDGFIVIHGVQTGVLYAIGDQLRLIRNEPRYLDFYNFKVQTNPVSAVDVSVLNV